MINADNICKQFSINNQGYSIKDLFISIFSSKRKADQKARSSFYALNNVSFNIKKGESLALIGRNGSGKSTLLKVLAGILYPTTGEFCIDGQVAALIELGAGFHPDLSGMENVFLNGALLGISERRMQEKLSDIIQFSELKDFMKEPIRHYSSGMILRLGFSIGAILEPDVLLVDEVLAVGDIRFQHKCIQKLLELKNKGISFIIVSHNIDMIGLLCDNVLWLENGKVHQYGGHEVLDAYRRYFMLGENNSEVTSVWINTEKQQENKSAIDIINAKIEDKGGKIRNYFYGGEDISLRVKYCVKDKSKRFFFAVLLSKSDYIIISKMLSKGELVESNVIGEREVLVTFKKIPLSEGQYYFSFAIIDEESNLTFDFFSHTLSFYVKDTTSNSELVHFPLQWKSLKVD